MTREDNVSGCVQDTSRACCIAPAHREQRLRLLYPDATFVVCKLKSIFMTKTKLVCFVDDFVFLLYVVCCRM